MTAVAIPTMSLIPKPGEVMLYVALHRVLNMTPVELLDFAKSLGFTPELRTKTFDKDRKTHVGVYVYAMLYHDQRDPESGLDADFLAAELEALCNRISPDTAVNFAYNLKQGRLDAA
ncbi:MAG: hypothetical protein JO235_19220 [Chroococcidiopsidaceae cyanobacterium CP_BM_RX_35]|nr:hypothetical protein [Chroococcidiopsidaceae cyanobacterium CP_BM_RX_35]